MKLSSLVVLFAASGDAKPTPEARAALKAKKNTQDLAWELLFNSGRLNSDKMGFIDVGDWWCGVSTNVGDRNDNIRHQDLKLVTIIFYLQHSSPTSTFYLGTSEENKVISPVCITGAMYMLAAGAKGQTQQEIFDILTKTLGQGPEETFQKYNDLRNFHSDSGNAHTLNIGKIYEYHFL